MVIVDVNGGAEFPVQWRDRKALRRVLSGISGGQE